MALARVFLLALSTLPSISLLLSEASPVSKVDPEVCQTGACQESARILLDAMDTSADPCHDFYQYACGGWIEKHSIPVEKTSYSTLDYLTDEVEDTVAEILKIATDEEHAKPVLDASILFQGCIDEEARETQGLDPLKNLLNSLGGWPMANPEWSDAGYQWEEKVATLQRTLGIGAILGISVDVDILITSRNIITLSEPIFGLDNEHLVNLTSSDRTREIIGAYRDYIIATGRLLNPNVDETILGTDADEIIQFESALTQPPAPVQNTRTSQPWYHELMDVVERKITEVPGKEGMTVSEAEKLTESKYFKWTDFLNKVFQDFPQVTADTEISLYGRSYIAHAIKLAHDTNPRIVANYIGWILLKNIGHHTTKDFRDNAFRFEKILKHVQKPKKLERVCVAETSNLLGFAVGRLYVDKHITEEEKRDVEELIEDIRSAYEVNLNHNAWMDPDTKNKALEKLRAMINHVGYPTWIKNDTELSDYYSAVQGVKKDEYFASLVKVKGAVEAKNLGKWNRPINRANEWDTLPSVVNAFYNPFANTMTFPAGIFNLPVYKYGGSLALNYAGIGSFVAHEISHGFDNDGSQRDKEGNLVDWWSPETKAKFQEKADCFREQYSSYVEPMTNMSLNGEMTLGDNIADNGAVRNAYMAYKLQVLQAQENEVTSSLRLPGLSATPEQLFFLGFGTMECARYTKESMKSTMENDEHAPAEYRVLVPLSNSRVFAESFSCPVGSRMNPESKCQLW